MRGSDMYINLQTPARPPAFLVQVPQLSATDAAVIVSAAVAAEYLLAKRAAASAANVILIGRKYLIGN
jgi:hypothetical protein